MTYLIERTLTRTDAFTLALATDTSMKRTVWLKVWTRALDEAARRSELARACSASASANSRRGGATPSER